MNLGFWAGLGLGLLVAVASVALVIALQGEPTSSAGSDAGRDETANRSAETYTATAKFERRLDPAAEDIRGAQSESFDSRKLTLHHDLAGRRAVERAAEDLGLFQGEESPRTPDGELTARAERARQALVRSLQQKLQVQWEVRSKQVDLIAVSFTHSDPELARKFADRIVHNYITRVSERIVERLSKSEEFLRKQVEQCERKHREAKDELIAFQSQHAGDVPAYPGGVDKEIRRIQADIEAVGRRHELAKEKLARLQRVQGGAKEHSREEGQATTRPAGSAIQGAASTTRPAEEVAVEPSKTAMVGNPRLDELQNELEAAREDLETLREIHHMTDRHPRVQAQKRRIALLSERIEETPGQVPQESLEGPGPGRVPLNVRLAEARSNVETTAGKLDRLEGRLVDLKALQANYVPIRKKYERLLEKLDSSRKDLQRWESRYQEVRMAREAETARRRTDHEIVQPARLR